MKNGERVVTFENIAGKTRQSQKNGNRKFQKIEAKFSRTEKMAENL